MTTEHMDAIDTLYQDINQYSPEKVGFELVDRSLQEEVVKYVHQAMEDNRDESLAIFDLSVVVKKFCLWRECFPNIQPYYAMKCYSDPAVLKLLSLLGAGFDCASKAEINTILKMGVKPEDIIFANPIKFPSHVQYAAENGVNLMTFDNSVELYKIRNRAPNARLLLRIFPIISDSSEIQFSDKYGCQQNEVEGLLELALSLGLKVVGVCFNVGSGCTDPSPYVANTKIARNIFDIAAKMGIHMDLLDIGGGMHGAAGGEDMLKKFCEPINAALKTLFPQSSGVSFMSEPGRYFVESGLTVATCIIGKRILQDSEAQEGATEPSVATDHNMSYTGNIRNSDMVFHYHVSEAIWGLIKLHLFSKDLSYKPEVISKYPKQKETYPSKLWGPSCSPFDIIQEKCFLPELQLGDYLCIPNLGAYNISLACTFNGIPPAKIRKIMNRSIWEKELNHQHKMGIKASY